MKKTLFLLCLLIFVFFGSFASAQDIADMQKQLAELKQELALLRGELTDTNRELIAPGTIAAYMGDSAPKGWLLCDGKTALDKPEYADLQAVLKGAEHVPNYCGYFLRGLDTTMKIDPNDPSDAARTFGVKAAG